MCSLSQKCFFIIYNSSTFYPFIATFNIVVSLNTLWKVFQSFYTAFIHTAILIKNCFFSSLLKTFTASLHSSLLPVAIATPEITFSRISFHYISVRALLVTVILS